jgi:hypothetical protein
LRRRKPHHRIIPALIINRDILGHSLADNDHTAVLTISQITADHGVANTPAKHQGTYNERIKNPGYVHKKCLAFGSMPHTIKAKVKFLMQEIPMGYNDLMNKVRQLDNRAAQWMGRHFYIILFEIILAIIFIFLFINALKILNIGLDVPKNNITDQLLLTQSFNSTLIAMLLILISLGVLNIINSNSRLRSVLKNIEFNLSKRRSDNKPQD